ncbi:Hypothetical predicted protein, partial [Podarcis lilfordi]
YAHSELSLEESAAAAAAGCLSCDPFSQALSRTHALAAAAAAASKRAPSSARRVLASREKRPLSELPLDSDFPLSTSPHLFILFPKPLIGWQGNTPLAFLIGS